MRPSNVEPLIATAERLRPMLGDFVCVGGAVTSLLVTDEDAGAPRTTVDVDAMTEITSYAEYTRFGERLRTLGFLEDASEGAPLCRRVQARIILDVMPLDEDSRLFESLLPRSDGHRDETPVVAGFGDPARNGAMLLCHEARSIPRTGQG